MKILFLIFGGIIVVAGAFVIMSLAGASKPSCADGAITVSSAAENSFTTKWNGFQAALRGGAATVTFTEEELTSRGVRYLADAGMPAKDLQVHLCPGAGKGEATMTIRAMGRDLGVVVAGHLDLGSKKVVVDSLQIGMVPAAVTTWLANRITGLASVQVPSEIRGATSTSTSVTLNVSR